MLADIQAKLKAPKDKENKFGGYSYRNCESILRAFKEIAPEGVSLTLSDEIAFIGEKLFLVSTARLSQAGQVIAEAKGAAMHALQKKGMDEAQITGACSSYARKYALCGLLAIDDSTDDPDAKDNRRSVEDAAEMAHHRAVTDAQAMLESAESLQELQSVWLTTPKEIQREKAVQDAKEARKQQLQQKDAA